jgi:hypothetical protein
VALLYLIWAVTYMFPLYGSYMCMDLDLELQSYYKNTLKGNKEEVLSLIDDYDDDIFAHDKEIIKSVFGFIIEFIAPSESFNVQEQYNTMIEYLLKLAETGDYRFPALFLFKCVLWDFKGVTDRKHKPVMSLIKRKKCISYIFQHLKGVLNYINIVNKKHTIFSRLIHFHSIEIYWQIKYNSEPDDVPDKEQACDYLANFLYNNIGLMDNNYSKSLTIFVMAKSCKKDDGGANRDFNQAINVIESSRQMAGFIEQDFPYLLASKLYTKMGKKRKD